MQQSLDTPTDSFQSQNALFSRDSVIHNLNALWILLKATKLQTEESGSVRPADCT